MASSKACSRHSELERRVHVIRPRFVVPPGDNEWLDRAGEADHGNFWLNGSGKISLQRRYTCSCAGLR